MGYWLIEQERAAASVQRLGVTPLAPAAPEVSVSVHGGSMTPAVRQAAETFHAANTTREWARRTGSDPAAIAEALRRD